MRTSRLRLPGSSAAALLASLLAPSIAAAQTDAAPIIEADDAQTGGDVVVTARRREERAQDVPIALSTVSGEQLSQSGSLTLNQVQQLAPSLQVISSNPRNTNINIRGLGSNVALAIDGLESGVGVYIDNVYYGRPGQSQFELVDLQQIEILRGPQGTLFGKNTTAGAINISSRPPSFDTEFRGEASGGNYGYHQLRASISGPLSDTVAARISVADTHRDGYITNVVDGSKGQNFDNFTVRGQLLFRPDDDFDVKLIGDYGHQNTNCCVWSQAAVFTRYDNGAPVANNFVDRLAQVGLAPLPGSAFDRRAAYDRPFAADMKSYGVSGEINRKLGGATLTSITAYRKWDWYPANDADYTAARVFLQAATQNRQRQFSQEVRLASDTKGRIDYVVGLFYFHQKIASDGRIVYGPDAAAFNLPPSVPAAVGNAALDGLGTRTFLSPTTRSYAAFGQATWALSDRLKLTGGLRYTYEKKSGEFRSAYISGVNLATLPPALAAAATTIRGQFAALNAYTTDFNDDSVSGLVTASYTPSRDVLLYGTYSRGAKSGGLNLAGRLPVGITPQVDPEKVDHFEAGLKSQWFDRTLTANLAAFRTTIKGYQSVVYDQPLGALTASAYIGSIPKVRSQGVEADLAFNPGKWVGLTASATYLDATYRSYANAPQAPERANERSSQDLSGQRLAGASKFSYALGADVAQPIGSGDLAAYAHVDFSHRSPFFTAVTNSRFSQVYAYGLVNARIGVRAESGRWDLSAWARNLGGENYFQTLTVQAQGQVVGIIGEPRTYGLTLRNRF